MFHRALTPKHQPFVILAVTAIALALWAQIADAASAEPVWLELNTTLERQVSGGQWHEYRFTLRSGEYAGLLLEQRSINVAVECYGPDDKLRFTADSHGTGENEPLELIGNVDGPYRLRVTAPDRHAPLGRYAITLRRVEAATEVHQNRIAAAKAFARGMAAFKPLVREALLQSIAGLEEALGHWRAAHDPSEEAGTLSEMGMMYIQLGDQSKATDCARQALTAARAARDRRREGSAIATLGVIQNNFGDKKTAIEYFDQALLLARESSDRSGEANILNYLGRAHFRSGQNRKALDYLGQALEAVRQIQDRCLEAYILGDIGQAYNNLGEYQRALENLQQELALERELENHGVEAVALNNIGFAYRGLGEYQKALDSFVAAADLHRQLDAKGDRLATSLHNIAWVYDRLGDCPRALQFYQEALDLLRAANNRSALANTLSAMGVLYSRLGDSARGLRLHYEALDLRRSSSDADGEAASLTNIGAEYSKLGESDKARENHERSVAILRTSGNQSLLAGALRNLGDHYRKTGDRARALPQLEEALEISRTIRDRQGEANALAALAWAEWNGGDLVNAQARADEALAAFESVRRTILSPNLRASFFATVREVQELHIEVLMRLHKQRPEAGFDAAALLASERGRARSLLELLAESGTGIRRGVDARLLARERELEQLIAAKAELQVRVLSRKHTAPEAAALAKELDALTMDFDQVQSRIRDSSPRYAALKQPAVLNLQEIQNRVLDEHTVLLEYALGKEKSFLWVVTPSSVEAFELPPRAEVEAVARRTYELLTARNHKPVKETMAERAARVRQADEAYRAAAALSSRMLLGAAASRIQKKRLLIVGEGVLQYLPFAALPEPGEVGAGSPDQAPLISNHEIVTAPSASVVAVLRQETADRRPAPKTLAVLADPVFSKDDVRTAQEMQPAAAFLKISTANPATRSVANVDVRDFLRLRFSRTEAEEIARLAPPDATLKALDFDASRETVLKPDIGQYRILHFATHSLLDNEHPELSGIVLSLFDREGRPQNGFLRLYDVYNLQLGADLVVLSACQTALGGDITGEGLIGLTRGFLYAGAPRVASTLWAIDDRATVEIMKRFYSEMLVRGQRPAAAMRSAQMAMWKSRGWDAPYYWAAFTLQGEWR